MPDKDFTEQRTFWDSEPEKRCGRCRKVKPLVEFGLIRGKRRSYCRSCHNSPPETWPSSRKCPRCKEVKDISEFTGQNRQDRGGRHYWTYCRACNTAMCRAVYKKRKASGKTQAENKKRYKTRRWERLLEKYGVSQEAYERMEAAQNGLCAICGQPETAKNYGEVCRLVVDHDHEDSGKVRDLLCRACNIALGYLKDDPVRAQRAADYLKRHKGDI